MRLKKLSKLGVVDGVTTNPSLIAKSGRDFNDVINEIVRIVDGPISGKANATTTDAKDIIEEVKVIADIHKNMVVKIPKTKD